MLGILRKGLRNKVEDQILSLFPIILCPEYGSLYSVGIVSCAWHHKHMLNEQMNEWKERERETKKDGFGGSKWCGG